MAPMPRRGWIVRLIALLLALLFLAGRAEAAGLLIIRDAETETLLRTYAIPLYRAAGLPDRLVRIFLVEDPAINAFVAPGNRMFLNTGLILRARDALEVIGVMAHETGHVADGHLDFAPEDRRAALLTSLAGLLIGAAAAAASSNPQAAAAGILGGTSLAERMGLATSRGREEMADQAALDFLAANHWSARGLLQLFETLRREERISSGRQDPYLQNHPLTSARIAFVRHQVALSRWSNAPLPHGWERRFAMVRAKLAGFLDPAAEVFRRYPATDHSNPARYARAIARFREGHIDAAVAGLDRLIARLPADPYLYELKGQILFEGSRPAAALGPYREAVRLAPTEPLIRTSLAQVMIALGTRPMLRAAAGALETSIGQDATDAFPWHELAIAQGRLGELGHADLALAEEALIAGRTGRARALAGRALTRLRPGPSRQRALDIRATTTPAP